MEIDVGKCAGYSALGNHSDHTESEGVHNAAKTYIFVYAAGHITEDVCAYECPGTIAAGTKLLGKEPEHGLKESTTYCNDESTTTGK